MRFLNSSFSDYRQEQQKIEGEMRRLAIRIPAGARLLELVRLDTATVDSLSITGLDVAGG